MVKKIKQGVVKLFHTGIYRFWIKPLEGSLLPRLRKAKAGPLQSWLVRRGDWWLNFGRVIVNNLRVDCRHWTCSDWSIAYVGSGGNRKLIRSAVFPENPGYADQQRIFFWQSPGSLNRYGEQADLLITEFNDVLQWRPHGMQLLFTVPASVKQVLEQIDQPMEEILAGMNQNTRRRIRQIGKQNFHYEFTQAQQDLDFWYDRMYCPYIHSRFVEYDVVLREKEFMQEIFDLGGLILVKQDADPICGMLTMLTEDLCEAWDMGVIDARFDLVKQGANVALWWFMLDWARQQGAKRFDFGASMAVTANGTFNFKRQWGTRVRRNRFTYGHYRFFGRNLPGPLRNHLNTQGFIAEHNDKYYQALLLDPEEKFSEMDLTHKAAEAAASGLDGVAAIHISSGEVLYYSAPAGKPAAGIFSDAPTQAAMTESAGNN